MKTKKILSYIIPPQYKINDYFAIKTGSVKFGMFAVPTVILPEFAPVGKSSIEIGIFVDPNLPFDVWTEAETEHISNESLAMVRPHLTSSQIHFTLVRLFPEGGFCPEFDELL